MSTTGPDISAGNVSPSTRRYEVTYPHDHKTLKIGDVVVMAETPKLENVLIRLTDMTLHRICDDSEQYVHLRLHLTGIISHQ